MTKEIEEKCEGSCKEHIGPVIRVKVTDTGKDWGEFNYCEAAIQEDVRRGLSVESLLPQPADVQERAKEYIRSKYGNPVKRGSVSSIDDVGDAYLAGASSVGGMRSLPEPFLQVLQDNWQAQIAGYYNVDKTDVERAKRQAVIDEYKDLISIFKDGSWRNKHEQSSSPSMQAENERLREYFERIVTSPTPANERELASWRETAIQLCNEALIKQQ